MSGVAARIGCRPYGGVLYGLLVVSWGGGWVGCHSEQAAQEERAREPTSAEGDSDQPASADGEEQGDDEEPAARPVDAGVKDAARELQRDAARAEHMRDAGPHAIDAGPALRDAALESADAAVQPVGSSDARAPGAKSCSRLPTPADYGEKGPFADAKMISNTGPNGAYTLFRPDQSLGKDGFKHPIATWGNGIVTTPNLYEELLTTVASHGFVVIAANTTMAERPALNAGLDWLVAQNGESGPLQDKLDVTTEVTIGYSWGGGAAIDTANRPNVVATVSFHGMPPRGASAFKDMHSPLLLFTSTGDTFVSAAGYVTPNYEKSTVQTFYATLGESSADHLYVLGAAGKERGPAIAWLRLWACDDEAARAFFYGDDCLLCKAPWVMPRRKNWP